MRDPAAGGGDADAPCGTCTACCRAAYFVHVAPEDVGARRRIPAELLVPAPGRPPGHMLLGYDEHGRCAMLSDDGCSIYEDRPRTCRAFDCRVHAAAGTSPDGTHDAGIADRVARWRFRLDEPEDVRRWTAVRIAARHLEAADLPSETALQRPVDIAVAALSTHEMSLDSKAPDDVDLTVALLPERNESSAEAAAQSVYVWLFRHVQRLPDSGLVQSIIAASSHQEAIVGGARNGS